MDETRLPDAESLRLLEDERRERNWKRWGPYLAERQWGTVREDYSADGSAWDYFTHEMARSRAYRWGEDGLLGITDREGRLCFAVALWNGRDPILKERLFGLTNAEGNHGEDVKECYFYLDSTPTHSYMKALYKYPQDEYPYERLVEESRRRDCSDPEFEITDAGVFDDGRYFDVFAEYAKAGVDDILVRLTVANRGSEAATLHLLPTLWFRNNWSWGCTHEGCGPKPSIRRTGGNSLTAEHVTLGRYHLAAEPPGGASGATEFLFTDNETNVARLFGGANAGPYVKDAFHEYVVGGRRAAVNPAEEGTKAAIHYRFELEPGEQRSVRLRLFGVGETPAEVFGAGFEQVFEARVRESEGFYAARLPDALTADECRVVRQAYAGLLWSKQFYHYSVQHWLAGDPLQPPPPAGRQKGRNSDWPHLYNRDVVSVPDKWEYPWYAAWDLAFHTVAFARIDPHFAKEQLILFLREWYMHPNGQIPAYEFNFSDVNPPVHAWAAWRIYNMTEREGVRDRLFLERVFQKLLINFTWWVNRKDPEGNHIFSGGFLGLDNIGVFDRSQPLLHGNLEQADGTAWMAFYCIVMLSMALELAGEEPEYEDIASKFFEHFIAIVDASNNLGGDGLWDEEDGFYYDHLMIDSEKTFLRLRSMVGLIPLFAVQSLEEDIIEKLPGFRKRMTWLLENRQDLAQHIAYMECGEKRGGHRHRLLAIASRERLVRVLRYLLDEDEFLSQYGVRSLSRYYRDHPFVFTNDGENYVVHYAPGESTTRMFGGNSNWRGPVWFPVNFLLVEALQHYHHFYGNDLQVECPTGSGRMLNLAGVAGELNRRLARIFLPDGRGRVAWHGEDPRFRDDPHWQNLLLFHEYFHGETGYGIGASHQTGWTALVALVIEDLQKRKR